MPCGYVQNHVIDGCYPGSETPAPIDRDFVTELWFESAEALQEAVSTPYYRSVLQPDESNFVAQDSVLRCLVDSDVLVDRGVAAEGKVFFFFPPGSPDIAAFRTAWQRGQQDIINSPGGDLISRWVSNKPRPSPEGDSVFGGIDEIWFAGAPGAIAGVFNRLLRCLDGVVDRRGCFYLITEEFTAERLLRSFTFG